MQDLRIKTNKKYQHYSAQSETTTGKNPQLTWLTRKATTNLAWTRICRISYMLQTPFRALWKSSSLRQQERTSINLVEYGYPSS